MSNSAQLLSKQLDIMRIKKENSRFRGNPNKTVINWGNSNMPDELLKCQVINSPISVQVCANKLSFFQCIRNSPFPGCTIPWTTNPEDARRWIVEGRTVVVRLILNGHSGEGIQLVNEEEDLPQAPLYTQYIPKKNEYRIHIMRGVPFIFQKKVVNPEFQINPINFKIRNLANGFIFSRNFEDPIPEDVITQAKNAFNAIPGLDFGSVDVIWNEYKHRAYALEINTASGLTGSTIADYANKFKEVLAA